MANLLVGDVHGCFYELMRVLEKSEFDASKDTLWLTGDLIARGNYSLEVLRFVKSLGSHARVVLGNHDLNFLAVHAGITKNKKRDNLSGLLNAPDCDELADWLRKQPLVQIDDQLKIIMTHAGVPPQWGLNSLRTYAHELESVLSSDSYPAFLNEMYGDLPNLWSDDLQDMDRLRYIANALTRIRFCYADGHLDMFCKESPEDAPKKLIPWFLLTTKIPADYHFVFGHWAALKGQNTPENVYGIDTGCCWGGKLTGLRWEDKKFFKKKAIKQNI